MKKYSVVCLQFGFTCVSWTWATWTEFLGDVYSIKWMEDSDRENLAQETLEKQYKIVRKETNTSMVCQFGDLSMGKLKVGDFQGEVLKAICLFIFL